MNRPLNPEVSGTAHANGVHDTQGLRGRIVLDASMSLDRIVELLQADQIERWRQGQLIPVESYLHLHEGLAQSPEHALDLIYGEHLLRQERDLPCSAEEYVVRFPQFAA